MIALTTVSDWPFDEPVRGSDETILIVPPSPPPEAQPLAEPGAHDQRLDDVIQEVRDALEPRYGRLEIDLGAREARLDGRRCDLTNHQFELLSVLLIVAVVGTVVLSRKPPKKDAK